MGKFDLNQYPIESAPKSASGGGGKFDWTQYPIEGQEKEEAGLDPAAALQGFGQFAASGYLPELTGVVGKMIPNPGAGVDAKLRAQGTKITQPEFQGVTTDESRAMQKQMASDSPYSYYGGGITGAITSAPAYGAALKGLGIAKEVPEAAQVAGAPLMARARAYAAGLGSRMVQTAKEGAALGFAANPNTDPGDEGFNLGRRTLNAGMTAGISAAAPVAGDAIKGTINAGKSAVKWGSTKLLSSLGGVKPDVIQEYAQFADRINAAPTVDALKQVSDDFVGKLSADVDANKISAAQAKDAYKGFQSDLKDAHQTAKYDARDAVTSAQQTLKDAHGARLQQLSGDVYDTINQLKSDVQKGSGDALKTLDKSDAMIDLGPTHDAIDNTMAKLQKSGTDESISIAGKLQSYKDRLAANYEGGVAPAADAKKLIQGLDQITTYSPMAGSFDQAKNAAFKGIRGSLDATLKDTVPEYAEKMQSVASDTDLLNRVSDFGDKQTGVGILGRIQAPNQLERRAALEELGKKYNADFVRGASPESLPEHQALTKAMSAQDALRPDRVAGKIDQTLATSRQQSALTEAEAKLAQSEEKLAPFKPLAENKAGQTQAQQKLTAMGADKSIELTDMFTQLGKLTDTDFVQAMKDQHTLSMFKKGAYNGTRNTAFGAVLGTIFGGLTGTGVGVGVGRVMDQWGPAITKEVLNGMIKVSKSPSIQAIRALNIPDPIKQQMITGFQNYLAQTKPFQGRVESPTPRGEDKWAKQGVSKLGIDSDLENTLLQDPKGKQLLIQASDLTPGSQAMKNIRNQIQKGWGQ